MNNNKKIRPSNYKISMKIHSLYANFVDYQNSNNIDFLKMGIPIVKELTEMGQGGFTEKEIKFIDSYINLCIEIGVG
jgi:hypothetical protein|tara:strand:- start:2373 stop:2603 length:231 start_codon:yes stop_codon:yes gene_type:complete